jgi:hypothetical protein
MLKKILPLALWLTATVAAFGQNAVMVNRSNSIITYPLNFWTANALVGRTGLGFNTNLSALWDATNAATARTAIGALATNGNGSAVTNLTAANITGTVALASNVTGTIAISNGGSGATTAAGARTNLSLGWLALTNPQSSLYSGTATKLLGYVPEINPSSSNLTGYNVLAYTNTDSLVIPANLLIAEDAVPAARNPRYVQINGAATISYPYVSESTIFGANYVSVTDQSTFTNSIATWGSNAVTMGMPIAFSTNIVAATTRTNLGLGASWLTNTNSSDFRTAIGLSITNSPAFLGVYLNDSLIINGTNPILISATNTSVRLDGASGLSFLGSNAVYLAAVTRTNLGLGWAALTNTNTSGFNTSLYGSGTNPVLYNTNGEVVSPTNFWQVSPANTRVQLIQPVANSTNTATNARELYLYSLAISTVGVTNTIQLPTNGGTFLGDVATVIHEGPTSSVTAVRQIGSGTNLMTMNQLQEAVKFIYETDGWRLADNLSFIEAIYFSGTNAAGHAAESRTNLGLGSTNDVTFKNVTISDQTLTLSQGPEDDVFVRNDSGNLELESPVQIIAFSPISFNNSTNAATTRVNLGLGETNSVTFSALTLSSDLTFGSGDNIVLSTTTGTKIGTATNQLLGFYNQTPITRPSSTGVTTNGFVANGPANSVHANSTFTGGIGTNAYTISDIVTHLKSLGLLAP